jgi:hypothetical protein
MLNVNRTSAPCTAGTLLRCAVLLVILAFPCSLASRMSSNKALPVSLAGSGPDTPISICRALHAAAADSARRGSRCMTSATGPPFQLLTDIAWSTPHHCAPRDAAGVAPNRRCQK